MHTLQNTTDVLRLVFEDRLMSRFGAIAWPARSPHLSACDLFLWSYLKFKVFQSRPRDLNELRQRIIEEIQAILQVMLQKVKDSIFNLLGECKRLKPYILI